MNTVAATMYKSDQSEQTTHVNTGYFLSLIYYECLSLIVYQYNQSLYSLYKLITTCVNAVCTADSFSLRQQTNRI